MRKLEDRVDSRVLRWFEHMVKMDDRKLVKRAMKAEVSERRPRCRSMFGWWDGGKQALNVKCGGNERACKG